MTDHRDIALADQAQEYLQIETELVDALAEAVTYRALLLQALERWSLDKIRLRGAETRLLQLAGIEPWTDCESL